MDFESKGQKADDDDEDADLDYGDTAVKIIFGHHKKKDTANDTDMPDNH